MPWNDASEVIVGQSGQVYAGALGSTLPTNPTSTPAVAFSGMGYHNEDGVRTTQTREITRIGAWQEFTPVRIARQSETFQLGFVLLQWNDVTLPAAMGGGTITNPSGSVYKFVPPTPADALDERAWICDVTDGSRHLRIIIPRGIVVETVESQFTRTAAGELPITVEALPPSDGSTPWHFYSDDAAAFATGS